MDGDTSRRGAMSYARCRYGDSRLPFRGPRRALDGDYVAFIGGTDTFGKFIDRPFAAQIEDVVGMPCVNLGLVNGGIDAFRKDRVVMETCKAARMVVVQVMGAQNLSNRFYTVHPRRNDRFLGASSVLQTLYPEVDFADYNFTRHMLGDLLAIDPGRFPIVRAEVQAAWTARMSGFIADLDVPVLLLWFADHAPEETSEAREIDMREDPLFVDRRMMDSLATVASNVVEVCPPASVLAEGTRGMSFAESERQAAAELLGLGAHAQATAALTGPIRRLLAAPGRAPGANMVQHLRLG